MPDRRLLIGLAVVLLLFCAGYGASIFAVKTSHTLLPGNEVRVPGPLAALPGLAPPADEPLGRINVLVMGIDRRPGKGNEYLPQTPGSTTDPGRSDTMAVVSVDPSTKSAAMLSIPRDLWLEVPDGRGGWTMDRINEPYHTGEVNKLTGGGGALAAQAITHNFGIPIDYWVDVDFNEFIALFDALGGIDINVPATLTATVLPRGDTGAYEYTYFPGRQHVNGELALGYARFRLDTEGDFGRIKRQQAVVLAGRQKALSLGWIDHPLDVWQKYSASVSTNVPAYKLPGLALLARQIQTDGIVTRSLGDSDAIREAVLPVTGANVLFPVPAVVAKIVGDTFGDPALSAATLAQLQRLYPGGGTPSARPGGVAAPAAGAGPSGSSTSSLAGSQPQAGTQFPAAPSGGDPGIQPAASGAGTPAAGGAALSGPPAVLAPGQPALSAPSPRSSLPAAAGTPAQPTAPAGGDQSLPVLVPPAR